MTRGYPTKVRRRVLRLYQRKDLTLYAIVAATGVSIDTVCRWAHEAGLWRGNAKRRTSPATIRRAVQMFAKGERSQRIAELLGVSRSAVDDWARERKVTRPAPLDLKRHPPSIRARAVEMYASGKSSTYCSDVFGVNATAILEWVREAGVEVRGAPQHRKLDDASILATYEREKSTRKVAELLGISRSGVRASLRRSNATTIRPRLRRIDDATIAEFHARLGSNRLAAQELGCAQTTVQRAMERIALEKYRQRNAA